ncbi:FAD-dependent oxidoreductase [Microvirga tunisiensis]|uniref:FAD-dependent oxidoreductase n=2 Tax=Pannonibacter tanglangensis TaxID=2750084 RepID=A0ABW9ZF92_9HYPH|nr:MULTISPECIES: FAD-binding oxidoreductase [unclassified Pannonibacter]NBN63518.1 FAD-dependent oxidoreductase [Pannonibacter sp. XCT-34]NBN77155.1 FAD-dependent oxidoreductase [Pannonibacter sp. XCT-53]
MSVPHEHVASFYRASAPRAAFAGGDGFLALDGRAHAEICVIGGGLAGLTTAHELARRGRRVLLLEADRIGWGASGRNAGFVSGGFAEGLDALEARLGLDHARRLHDLSRMGVQYVAETLVSSDRRDIVGGRGGLSLWRTPPGDALDRRQERLASLYGLRLDVWDRSRLADVLATSRYHGALHDAAAFHIDPLAYARLMAERCRGVGVWIFEASPVCRVAQVGAGWRVETDRGVVHCEQVVLATSAYGVLNHTYRPLDRAILPVATYVVTTEPLGARLTDTIRFRGCLSDTRRAGDYYRVVAEDRLLWGGRITTRRGEPHRLAERLKADILRIYPQLGDFKVEFAWSGLMGYTRHRMPLIGQFKPGLWVATGFGGHGLNTTAMAGVLVAAAIAEGDDRWTLFAPFKARWGGGVAGRVATQIEYWRLQALDRFAEQRAG